MEVFSYIGQVGNFCHVFMKLKLVKVRWDFNKKSTSRLCHKELHPKSLVNPRDTSEVIDKRNTVGTLV